MLWSWKTLCTTYCGCLNLSCNLSHSFFFLLALFLSCHSVIWFMNMSRRSSIVHLKPLIILFPYTARWDVILSVLHVQELILAAGCNNPPETVSSYSSAATVALLGGVDTYHTCALCCEPLCGVSIIHSQWGESPPPADRTGCGPGFYCCSNPLRPRRRGRSLCVPSACLLVVILLWTDMESAARLGWDWLYGW